MYTVTKYQNEKEVAELYNLCFHKDHIIAPNDIVFVARKDSDIVGFIHIRELIEYPDFLWIHCIAIYPSMRRLGAGTCLIKYVTNYAKDKQLCTISLMVNLHNYPAISLYKKTGFKHKNGLLMTLNLDETNHFS
jgi:ribosomal protein S18 acetylase RimI-like enzyme